jgi:hypothetical protein
MRRTAMKTIVVAVAALAALTGCATQRPAYYSKPACKTLTSGIRWKCCRPVRKCNRAPGPKSRPSRRAPPAYTTQPAYTTTYVSQPVYYAPAPVYYAPAPAYYYPPVSIGLDFSFGRWCCGHRCWPRLLPPSLIFSLDLSAARRWKPGSGHSEHSS